MANVLGLSMAHNFGMLDYPSRHVLSPVIGYLTLLTILLPIIMKGSVSLPPSLLPPIQNQTTQLLLVTVMTEVLVFLDLK